MVASAGCSPVVRGGHIPEVDTWPIPKGNWKIGQGPEAQTAIKHLLSKRAHSPDHTQELPCRQVGFHMPEGGDAKTERKEPVTKPTVKDLEAWLEHQVGVLGTPAWWRELETVLDIKDTCKFA